jgi:hypothetical protein
MFFLLFIISFVYIFFLSFVKFLFSFVSSYTLHSENTKLGVSGLDLVTATHGGSQTEAKVVASVLGRDDAVVLLWFRG